MKKSLLVLNAGSSSLKFAVFQFESKKLGKELISGSVSKSNQGCDLEYQKKKIHYLHSFSIKTAWQYVHDLLVEYNIVYVGFRMVHGGEEFVKTTKVTKEFLKKIEPYNKLAPLHNPASLELIKLVKRTWPRLKMSVSFDTAWYKDMEPVNYLYSLPLKYYTKYGIRKYGFHGLSHEMATKLTAQKLKKSLKKLNIITCHLGAGSSITWYKEGRVIDTSMGYSPNDGVTMATRSGDLPADIILYLMSELKMSVNSIQDLLSKQSGLLGLAKTADLREILLANGYRVAGFRSSLKFSTSEKKQAKLALNIFVYNLKRYIASYLGMSSNLEAIVFTGGIGVKSSIIRKLVLQGLNIPKKTKILVIPESENINLGNKTLECLL